MEEKKVLPTPPKDFHKLPPRPFPKKESEEVKQQEVADSSMSQNSENLENIEAVEKGKENVLENAATELGNANENEIQPIQTESEISESDKADENEEIKKEKKKINLKPLWWIGLVVSVLLGFGLIFLLIFFE